MYSRALAYLASAAISASSQSKLITLHSTSRNSANTIRAVEAKEQKLQLAITRAGLSKDEADNYASLSALNSEEIAKLSEKDKDLMFRVEKAFDGLAQEYRLPSDPATPLKHFALRDREEAAASAEKSIREKAARMDTTTQRLAEEEARSLADSTERSEKFERTAVGMFGRRTFDRLSAAKRQVLQSARERLDELTELIGSAPAIDAPLPDDAKARSLEKRWGGAAINWLKMIKPLVREDLVVTLTAQLEGFEKKYAETQREWLERERQEWIETNKVKDTRAAVKKAEGEALEAERLRKEAREAGRKAWLARDEIVAGGGVNPEVRSSDDAFAVVENFLAKVADKKSQLDGIMKSLTVAVRNNHTAAITQRIAEVNQILVDLKALEGKLETARGVYYSLMEKEAQEAAAAALVASKNEGAKFQSDLGICQKDAATAAEKAAAVQADLEGKLAAAQSGNNVPLVPNGGNAASAENEAILKAKVDELQKKLDSAPQTTNAAGLDAAVKAKEAAEKAQKEAEDGSSRKMWVAIIVSSVVFVLSGVGAFFYIRGRV